MREAFARIWDTPIGFALSITIAVALGVIAWTFVVGEDVKSSALFMLFYSPFLAAIAYLVHDGPRPADTEGEGPEPEAPERPHGRRSASRRTPPGMLDQISDRARDHPYYRWLFSGACLVGIGWVVVADTWFPRIFYSLAAAYTGLIAWRVHVDHRSR